LNLGRLYFRGEGVPRDAARGLRLAGSAADIGYAVAQIALGDRYREGDDAPADVALALRYYGMAAAQGDPTGQIRLGPQAYRLFRQAAELGHGQCQFNLATYCRDGRAAAPDPAAAYVWFSLADRAGVPQAQDRAQVMQRLLDPAQLAEAERRVAERKPMTR